MLYNTLSMGRKPPKPHFPLEFRHPAEGRLSNGHRQHAQKLVKIVRAVPEISLRIDRHTHTDILTIILCNRAACSRVLYSFHADVFGFLANQNVKSRV